MDLMSELAWKHGKHDLERLGIFIEMPYMNGKGYVSPFPKPKIYKGRNIMCEGRKSKNGTQHGYFDDAFRRLFEGEAIPRPPKRKAEGKNVSRVPFIPAGIPKWHSTPGDHYGTFGGVVEAFGTGRDTKKKKTPYVKEKPNCLTGPAKKGGPGYANICFSKYPEHLPDPYRPKLKPKEYGKNLGRAIVTVYFPQPFFEKNPYYEETLGPVYIRPKVKPPTKVGAGKWVPTGPAKWQGGCHAGLFAPFPEHMTDRDPRRELQLKKQMAQLKKKLIEKGIFGPQALGNKTMNTCSIMLHNTNLYVNTTNYKTYETNYTNYLLAKVE
ncbi:hypothetical protein ILUMI_20594 [Ignelater luminosus]|uniref:Cilia-and flagella-associated protein 96 n=1 Tax=Ignelater luminosus TaxID=2038154 RepID=A0A8K0CKJ8_IGNLU|nr:hypothetical protein ILUMI_20594 [Ignelater luminosus]